MRGLVRGEVRIDRAQGGMAYQAGASRQIQTAMIGEVASMQIVTHGVVKRGHRAWHADKWQAAPYLLKLVVSSAYSS